jgi:hypothetical protein
MTFLLVTTLAFITYHKEEAAAFVQKKTPGAKDQEVSKTLAHVPKGTFEGEVLSDDKPMKAVRIDVISDTGHLVGSGTTNHDGKYQVTPYDKYSEHHVNLLFTAPEKEAIRVPNVPKDGAQLGPVVLP